MRALGRRALNRAGAEFALGTAGAGTGATRVDLKGGLGSASIVLDNGIDRRRAGRRSTRWGRSSSATARNSGPRPFEIGDEFGGFGQGTGHDPTGPVRTKIDPGGNTTIAIVATDAALTKAQAKRMAIAAHDGIARAIVPSHTPFDGDLVFAAATGARPIADAVLDTLLIGHAAATCLARAIARGVFNATPAPNDPLPCWSQRHGGR